MAEITEQQINLGVALQEEKPKLQPPALYQVIINNDDYTPMEFVVQVLQMFFNMHFDRANHIMLQVHTNGRGVCGLFNREIAETKVVHINNYAKKNQHPLLCTMEQE